MSKKKGEKLLAKLAQTASEEAERGDAGPRKKIKICLDLTAGKLPQPPTPEEIQRNLLDWNIVSLVFPFYSFKI